MWRLAHGTGRYIVHSLKYERGPRRRASRSFLQRAGIDPCVKKKNADVSSEREKVLLRSLDISALGTKSCVVVATFLVFRSLWPWRAKLFGGVFEGFSLVGIEAIGHGFAL